MAAAERILLVHPLGYAAEAPAEPAPRKENYVYRVK